MVVTTPAPLHCSSQLKLKLLFFLLDTASLYTKIVKRNVLILLKTYVNCQIDMCTRVLIRRNALHFVSVISLVISIASEIGICPHIISPDE